MSNVNAPFGLRPIRKLGGGAITLNAYTIASGYNTALGKGDPVKMTGTGKNIALAAAGDTACGIFAGCKYIDTQNNQVFSDYWPASATTFDGTDLQALVWDDPDLVCEIQALTIAKGDVGAMADWVCGTPSSTMKQSTAYLSSTYNTTNLGLRVMGLSERLNNDYGAYAVVEVIFAEHALKGITAGVGGV